MSTPRDQESIAARIATGQCIARGNGRSYGDSAIHRRHTLDMRHWRHMLAFDPRRGILTTEAGVLLDDVIATFLPRGWFVPVTPGTRFVTIGGMIAADVHGKNHHRQGSFGNFVRWIDVIDHRGVVRRCSRQVQREWFEWTIGGMGLTGIILRAAFTLMRVESAWIRQTTRALGNLRATMEAFETHGDAAYSVAWIDALAGTKHRGRSILALGEHAPRDSLDPGRRRHPYRTPARRSWSVPCPGPSWFWRRGTARVFNHLYYHARARRAGTTLVDLDRYFYPLDSLRGWNRLYGRGGFVQFQCVVPLDASAEGLERLLETVAASGQGAFLAVLKRLGAQKSRLSFPMEGYTLAMDFPATPSCLSLLEKLDRITIDHGGRFYLAKDARLRPEVLRRADPRIETFAAFRKRSGAIRGFASAQSERLKL